MKYALLLLALAFMLNACRDTNSADSSTLRLTTNHVVLSGSDTTAVVNATLTTGCDFEMEGLCLRGDTSLIRFNTGDLCSRHHTQNIAIVANPCRTTASHISACLSFQVNDRDHMNRPCRDSVWVDYYKSGVH